MKRYAKELIIFVLQLFMFHVFPLFAGPTDAIGMVLLILFATLLLSLIIGVASNNRVKYLYPLLTSVAFIPSVFIYYNETALVHSLWYLAVAGIGLLIGSSINVLARRMKRKK